MLSVNLSIYRHLSWWWWTITCNPSLSAVSRLKWCITMTQDVEGMPHPDEKQHVRKRLWSRGSSQRLRWKIWKLLSDGLIKIQRLKKNERRGSMIYMLELGRREWSRELPGWRGSPQPSGAPGPSAEAEIRAHANQGHEGPQLNEEDKMGLTRTWMGRCTPFI